MNEFTHPFIKSTPPHIWYQKKAVWVANLTKINHVGSVHSANQNRDFKCSVIDPAKPKMKTKWRHGKQPFIGFATFLWIISSFCIDILTKCFTVFINKVIILVHVVRLTLEAFLGCKFTKLTALHFSGRARVLQGQWARPQSAGLNQRIFMSEKIIKIIVLNGSVSFLFYLAANTSIYISLNGDVYSSMPSLSGSTMKCLFIFDFLIQFQIQMSPWISELWFL